jgi:hypothetical protein
MYIQQASEHLAKAKLLLKQINRHDLVEKIQDIKDELNIETIKLLGEDVICMS